jgi:hypothetical protein
MVIRLSILITLILSGCDDGYHTRCIDGVLYYRQNDSYRLVDGAEAHAGITPVPCKSVPEIEELKAHR